MEAELLWKELHHQFDTDDGSLPEIWIMNLSRQGVAAIFSYLQHACQTIANSAVFWSREDQQDKPVNSVANAAALVVEGRAEPFHCVCHGLSYEGVVLPDIGVFVCDDQIAIDYRMGQEWNALKLKALFGMLKKLKDIDIGAEVCLEYTALRQQRKHFEATWERFLQETDDV